MMQNNNTDAVAENTEQAPVSDITQVINNLSGTMPEWLQPYWEQVQSVPLLAFSITVIAGYVVAKILVMLLTKSLGQITKRTKSDVDDQLIETVKRPLFLIIFFLFLSMAVKTIGLSASLEGTLIRILASILVLNIITRGFRVCHILLDSLSRNMQRFEIIQPKTIPLFELIGKILIIGLGSYVLLIIWGINPTAWLASAGVIGIAVGFAARDTLANLFSGFFIIADTPYKVGDFINLDTGERGMVTHVGMRSTRLLTRDDIEITIPNNVIGNAKIINESGGRSEKSRIRIQVGAAYGADVKLVCEVLQQVAEDHAEVIKNPTPRVRMRAFGGSSLDFELLVWIAQPVLRGRIKHELLMQVYDAFNQAGIEIPYTKQDLYIKEFPNTRTTAE